MLGNEFFDRGSKPNFRFKKTHMLGICIELMDDLHVNGSCRINYASRAGLLLRSKIYKIDTQRV